MVTTLKKKLQRRQKELLRKGSGGYKYIVFKDEGTLRLRPLPVGKDLDWAQEITFFYLGSKIKGYISPKTFGMKCPIYNLWKKLNESKSSADKEFAKTFSPKQRYMVPHLTFKDLKGKLVDKEVGPKLVLLTNGQYKDLLDLYLDPEQGDFTDPKTGYDIKYKRTGKGMTDTEYSLLPCRPTPLPKEFNKIYDPEEMVKAIIPSWEEALEIKREFMSGSEEQEERPKKKKKKKIKKDI